MLVYFDENGVLKEQLDSYGNLPRVGSQYFKIFAYFDGIDLDSYGAAYIRFQRPDLSDSSYPILFMVQADLTYDPEIPDGISQYFSENGGPNNGTYPCYLFDFSQIINIENKDDPDDDHVVTLLDTPGQWIATITLLDSVSGATNVVGTISFNVDGEDEEEQETDINFNVVVHNLATQLARKLSTNSISYLRTLTNFEAHASAGDLAKSVFVIGALVWDSAKKTIYKINAVTDNPSYPETLVSCSSYDIIIDFNKKSDIANTIHVVGSRSDIVLSDYENDQIFFVKNENLFYKKNGNSLEEFNIFDPGDIYVTVENQPYIIPPEDR